MLRLLYIPNETIVGDQIGPRAAFEENLRTGRLEAFDTYSFLVEAKRLGSWQRMLDDLMQFARAFAPTAILWEMQTRQCVPTTYAQALRALPSRPVVSQRTGDSYWRPPRTMVRFGRGADLTLLTGTSLIPAFQKAGCRNVQYLPERFDLARFGSHWTRSAAPEFDVVMIANYYRQWWFRRFPGQELRRSLAKAFAKRFGCRFGLFGRGWNGWVGWQGFLPYGQQHEAMRRSRLVLGVNNWNDACYFSDRLPISLASGVPVLYKHFPGADELFQEGKHLWYYHDMRDALAKAEVLLARPQEELDQVAACGAELARNEFSCKRWAEQLLALLEELQQNKSLGPA